MVKVIGIGSRIMMDDGIGVRVVEDLREWLESNGYKSIIGETDAEGCIDEIEEGDFVIIIDAALFGDKPGTIHKYSLSDIKASYKSLSMHDMSFLELIGKYHKNIKGYVLGIEAFDIRFGTELSRPLSNNYLEIVNHVKRAIESMKED